MLRTRTILGMGALSLTGILSLAFFGGCREGSTKPEDLRLACSVAKPSVLVGEPVRFTAVMSNLERDLGGEPWFFEGGTTQIAVLDAHGNPPPPPGGLIVDTRAPKIEGVDTRGVSMLLFERELLVGSLHADKPAPRVLSLEEMERAAGQLPARAAALLRPGTYGVRIRYRFYTEQARERAGMEALEARCEVQVAEIPENERAAAALFALRPTGSEASREAVLASFRELAGTYPDSVYAPWARYFAAKLLVEMRRWEEARELLDGLADDPALDRLPRYQIAYLRALTLSELGETATARRVLRRAVPKDTLVFLDTVETGRQEEGWRLFELERSLENE